MQFVRLACANSFDVCCVFNVPISVRLPPPVPLRYQGQVMHLLSTLPEHYGVVGYAGNGHGGINMGDPRRHHDFQTGIIYDERHLRLIGSDHFWLSKTPRVEGSKDWGSIGIRTATVGVFRTRSTNDTVVHINGT